MRIIGHAPPEHQRGMRVEEARVDAARGEAAGPEGGRRGRRPARAGRPLRGRSNLGAKRQVAGQQAAADGLAVGISRYVTRGVQVHAVLERRDGLLHAPPLPVHDGEALWRCGAVAPWSGSW
jgi:hypothetical protein